jgi:hypothetical protein
MPSVDWESEREEPTDGGMMRPTTRSARAMLSYPASLVLLVPLIVVAVSIYFTTQSPAVEQRWVSLPGSGYLSSGSEVDDSSLAQALPPPPLDAVPYEVRTPLFNGAEVVKHRWLWVPEGEVITADTDVDGEIAVTVPVGTKLWKEFSLRTESGVHLVERRVIARVDPSVDPSGWRYFASHTDPALAEAVEIDDGVIRADTSSATFDRFTWQPEDWLPTQTGGASELAFIEDDDVHGYVFPGQANCSLCHGGAAGAYSPAGDAMVAFALNPENLEPESLARIAARGWMRGSAVANIPAPDLARRPSEQDDRTARLVGYLRNNCASCHNTDEGAAARMTALHLDPNRKYSTAELADTLSTTAIMMGDRGLPLVEPGDPGRSEIMLRVEGLEGRRRMPPLEGGVPVPDAAFTSLLREWIENLPAGEETS